MASHCPSSAASILAATMLAGLLASAVPAAAQTAPILKPGAPGQPTRPLSAEQATRIADTSFSPDDVRFMQDMIAHHRQALDMAALVKGRTNRPAIVELARRIEASQADEIRFMTNWLRSRGQPFAAPHPAHMAHAGGPDAVAGMATPAQMAELAAAKGVAFDRLFVERMIAHHQGAVTMAEKLLDLSGSAYEPALQEFVNEVISDQKAEIKRMNALVPTLAADPRTGLKAGFRDAGQALANMRLVASLPKPTGFFDPKNPAGLPPQKPAKGKKAGAQAEAEDEGEDNRSPLLNFGNTDMAFSGDLLAVGNYHGFNFYRLGADGVPSLISSTVCPGGQGDLSIVGNLMVMSVEQRRARKDCGLEGVRDTVSPDRLLGLRIFDISNPALPVQVGQVQTCRGSHTHSVVSGPGADGTIVVYVSGTAPVRKDSELAGCVGQVAGDPRTAMFRIDVVEIPLSNPAAARIVDSPAVFADPATGNLAGLYRGGDGDDPNHQTAATDECHDITVYPMRSLAAGACSGNGIILDISDPRKPRRIDAVFDPGFAYWHSATFNNDGTKVLFTDEWGGGGRPRCQVHDPRNWGANAIYDIVDGKLRFRSHYKLPAAQSDKENCVAHNGSIVPVPGRDVFVQAWYQGGISVIDFTDSGRPVEIAFFDRGPINAKRMIGGGFWSAYYYRGKVYATEILRGLDVLALTPSEHLSANEIAAAALADYGGRFNPQQQFPVSWPDHPAVALAYVDQLERSNMLAAPTIASLRQALAEVGNARDAGLAARLRALAAAVPATSSDPVSAKRLAGLRSTLDGIARRIG